MNSSWLKLENKEFSLKYKMKNCKIRLNKFHSKQGKWVNQQYNKKNHQKVQKFMLNKIKIKILKVNKKIASAIKIC